MELSIKLYKGEKELWSYLCETNKELSVGYKIGSEIWSDCCVFFTVFLEVYSFSTVIFLLLLKWKNITKKEKRGENGIPLPIL